MKSVAGKLNIWVNPPLQNMKLDNKDSIFVYLNSVGAGKANIYDSQTEYL